MAITTKAKVLKSEWVQSKKNGMGYELKKGAPEKVKKEFEEYKRLSKR